LLRASQPGVREEAKPKHSGENGDDDRVTPHESLLLTMSSRPLDNAYATRSGENNRVRQSDEETVLEHSCGCVQSIREQFRIRDSLA
jgi:hypothetical protein